MKQNVSTWLSVARNTDFTKNTVIFRKYRYNTDNFSDLDFFLQKEMFRKNSINKKIRESDEKDLKEKGARKRSI